MFLTAQIKAAIAAGLRKLDDINLVTGLTLTTQDMRDLGFMDMYGHWLYNGMADDERLRPDYPELQRQLQAHRELLGPSTERWNDIWRLK